MIKLSTKLKVRLVALAMGLPLAGAALGQAVPQVVGIASALVNQVNIASGAGQFHRAVLRERVSLADRVQTGPNSQLQLMLLDKSVFSVGANARLTIDRFVYDPSRGSSLGATVAKGAFRFMSGRRGDGSASSIRTPVATIGIRGTIVEGVIGADAVDIAEQERGLTRGVRSDRETASLIVLRGPGPQTQGAVTVGAVDVEAAGVIVALGRPLQASYVPRAGARPIGPFTISAAGVERINAAVFPSLGRRWGVAIKKKSGIRFGIGISGSSDGGGQGGQAPTQPSQPRPPSDGGRPTPGRP
jgi:hypothetical protein